MVPDLRWNAWNLENATKHGVSVEEAEHVVRNAGRPYPGRHDAGMWLVVGRGDHGRMVEVIFVYDDARDTVYIIHAMPTRGNRRRRRAR
jgi:uncharacterized DUF497 family protein